MRVIRGLSSAQRSIIARVSSLEPPSTQMCSTPNVTCCKATEASVRSIVAAAFRLTVTIESKRSVREHSARASQNAAGEEPARAASCIITSLHKTPANAFFKRRTSAENCTPLPCPAATAALVGSSRLPRHHGRRTDLCFSSVRETPYTASGRSLPAKYFAGSIHIVLTPVFAVHRFTGVGECGSAAHADFYRLVPCGGLEFCLRRYRPRHRVAGGRIFVDRRRRLRGIRCVPGDGSNSNGTLTGRSIDRHRAWLSRTQDE